jgi:MFS family permease
VPIGLVGLALTAIFIPNQKEAGRRPFDVSGFVLSGMALTCLMYGMELIGQLDVQWPVAAAVLAGGVLSGALALRHFRRAEHPLVDLGILRIPTVRAAIGGGSLYNTAVNVAPFMLPLLFQIGFGMTAFASGLLVLAYAAGNLGMKSVTTPILKRFGFRSVMIANGLLTAATVAACSALSPSTPHAVVVAVLLLGGLCRSMQMTSINTLVFADVPPPAMSSASTLFSVTQQMTIGMGIAVGAITLHFAVWLHGGGTHLGLADFQVAFAVVAALVLVSIPIFIGIERNAGADVSGHRPAPAR